MNNPLKNAATIFCMQIKLFSYEIELLIFIVYIDL